MGFDGVTMVLFICLFGLRLREYVLAHVNGKLNRQIHSTLPFEDTEEGLSVIVERTMHVTRDGSPS